MTIGDRRPAPSIDQFDILRTSGANWSQEQSLDALDVGRQLCSSCRSSAGYSRRQALVNSTVNQQT